MKGRRLARNALVLLLPVGAFPLSLAKGALPCQQQIADSLCFFLPLLFFSQWRCRRGRRETLLVLHTSFRKLLLAQLVYFLLNFPMSMDSDRKETIIGISSYIHSSDWELSPFTIV